MDPELSEKQARLVEVLEGLGSVLVALSGGVDSALLARVARDALGDRAVLFTGDSPTLPASEAEAAGAVAAGLGLRHVTVRTDELAHEAYARNAGDRCYHCKSELFRRAAAERDRLGLAWVVDGTLVDDLADDRPGMRAAAEVGVRHPLLEAGLHKIDVRALARELGLPVWDKPALACLGSRFPVGTRITADKVGRVGRAEAAVRALGFRQVRVRWHELGADVLARVELAPEDIARAAAADVRDALVEACRAEGFRWVALDLLGWRREAPVAP